MIESGNWAATHLNGQLFLEKPPLYTWTLAGALKLFGYHAWAVRIPVFLFTLGTLALTFFLARQVLGVAGAQAAVISLATTGLFFEVNHGAMIDNGLIFFTTLAMLAFARVVCAPKSAASWPWAVVFYAGLGLAFLCKGAVGPLLVLAAAGLFVIAGRRWRIIADIRPFTGIAVVSAIVGPWLAALWARGGAEYFYVVFVRHHLNRFAGIEGPSGSLFHYIPILPVALVPWTLLAPCAAWSAWRRFTSGGGRDREFWRLILCWICGMFILLSVPRSKDHQYLMPLLPAFAITFGAWVEHTLGGGAVPKWARVLSWIFLACVAALVVCLPLTAFFLSGARLVPAAWAVVMAAACVPALRAMSRGAWREMWRSAAALAALSAISIGAFVEPGMDRMKSMRPLREEIAARMPPGVVIYEYGLNENSLGFLLFHGIRPVSLRTGADAVRVGHEDAPALMVVESRRHDDEAAGQLASLPRWGSVGLVRAAKRCFHFIGNAAYLDTIPGEGEDNSETRN